MHVESPAQTTSTKAIGAFSLFCSVVPMLGLVPCLSNQLRACKPNVPSPQCRQKDAVCAEAKGAGAALLGMMERKKASEVVRLASRSLVVSSVNGFSFCLPAFYLHIVCNGACSYTQSLLLHLLVYSSTKYSISPLECI